MKSLIVTLIIATAGCAFAQTTETAATSRPAMQRDALFTSETFTERLNKSQELYEKAGIPADKIQKMRELDEKALSDQARGQSVNYVKMRQERRKILTPEEMAKLQEVQKEMATDSATTPTM